MRDEIAHGGRGRRSTGIRLLVTDHCQILGRIAVRGRRRLQCGNTVDEQADQPVVTRHRGTELLGGQRPVIAANAY
jgi:hypothetical protein